MKIYWDSIGLLILTVFAWQLIVYNFTLCDTVSFVGDFTIGFLFPFRLLDTEK